MSLDIIVRKQKQIMTYMNKDISVARKLFESKGNLEATRQILKESATDDFVNGIVDTAGYEPFVMEVAEEIMALHPEAEQETLDAKLGLRKVKKTKVKKKVAKKHVSTTKSGKTYKKTYLKWNESKETFIKSRANLSGSAVVKDYQNTYNDGRTKSSILTKFYRLRR